MPIIKFIAAELFIVEKLSQNKGTKIKSITNGLFSHFL